MLSVYTGARQRVPIDRLGFDCAVTDTRPRRHVLSRGRTHALWQFLLLNRCLSRVYLHGGRPSRLRVSLSLQSVLSLLLHYMLCHLRVGVFNRGSIDAEGTWKLAFLNNLRFLGNRTLA